MQNFYPRPGRANYVLGVLLLAYILSFIDRNILAILVGPIRQDFSISDVQFSILHGWAFTILYVLLGVPFGWLADRVSRRWIIIGGVFLWSFMTCMAGWAYGFWTLFLVRVGVGIGEATLSPAAYSLMSDYFPPERLRWATSVFAMGITLGGGLSYIVGGWLYDFFDRHVTVGDGYLSSFSAWQLTFIAVGLPGLIVVGLLLLVREPPRRHFPGDSTEPVHLSDVAHHVVGRWQVYLALAASVSMMSIIGYGTLAWFPEFLIRTYDVTRSQAGSQVGSILMVAGTIGALLGAGFSGFLQRMGYLDANLRLVMLAAVGASVPAVVAPLMPSSDWALMLIIPVILLHYSHFGVAMAALQIITPNRMRAQVSAVMLLMTNLLGLAMGGTIVALFTDFLFRSDDSLYLSLALLAGISYPAAAVIAGWGLRYYRRALPHSSSGAAGAAH